MDYLYIGYVALVTTICSITNNIYWYQAINYKRDNQAIIVNIYLLFIATFAEVAMYPDYMVRGQEPGSWETIGLVFLFFALNITFSLAYAIFYRVRKSLTNYLAKNSQES